MPSFPSYAEISYANFAEQRESGLLRTEMESGPPKQAVVKARVLVTRPVTIILFSKADYIAFVDWFATTLKEGALWFDFMDPVRLTTKQARFVGGGLDGSPMAGLELWSINTKIETWG